MDICDNDTNYNFRKLMNSEITWGTLIPTFDPFGTGMPSVAESARRAEALGYDALWVGDHLISPAPVLDSICTLSAAAAVTSNIGLGIAVLQLGLRNLVWTAKQLITLDTISTGRMRIGLGVGGEFPDEFQAAGVDVKTRGRRLDEMILYLNPLLTGQSVSYTGEEIQIECKGLRPALANPIPLSVGGRSDAALRRTARFGDQWIGMWYDPEAMVRHQKRLTDLAQEYGRDVPGMSIIVLVNVNDDKDAARLDATSYLKGQYGLPFHVVERWTAYGSAGDVAEMIHNYVKVGVSEFILAPAASDYYTQYERLVEVRRLVSSMSM